MSEHRYPRSASIASYRRAGIGVFLTAGPVIWGRPITFLVILLGGLALVFAVYGGLAFLRARTRYTITLEGITADGPIARRIPWAQLATLNLKYYATKMEQKGGWLQLTLKGAGNTIHLESTLDEFPTVVASAVAAARTRDVELSPVTLDNLRTMGLEPKMEAGAPCPTS